MHRSRLTSTRPSRSTASVWVVSSLLLVVSLLGIVTAVGPAAGADQVAILSTDEDDHYLEPGESTTIDVDLFAEGGHDDDGVVALEFVAEYDPDVLEITDIERGPWLEQGTETTVHAEGTLAHDEGTALLEQWRDPVAGGATGLDTVATVTVTAHPDAPAGETALEFGETDIELESEWPVPVVDGPTTVVIEDDEAVNGESQSADAADTDTTDAGGSERGPVSDVMAAVSEGYGSLLVTVFIGLSLAVLCALVVVVARRTGRIS
ncbi:hypothetical protein C483_12583 [Natrialba hulunbeirensis JCM 10989]|uniref:Cohesin domain-containing protein n=1 Tax=Natrialba hulunbeirensis JCM 10989 TaxID=1227493 RepID=L9ZXL2_9EURY|nr:hypothetical protein C483_12583 [Natrialba hulunbeirensis JCM 10989]